MNETAGQQAYERKLGELQRYIPFLCKMIAKIERTNDPTRASQLQKMRHLHGILTDRTRKLKYDLLVKCEGVLQKLHDKIEGEADDEVMEVPQPISSQQPAQNMYRVPSGVSPMVATSGLLPTPSTPHMVPRPDLFRHRAQEPLRQPPSFHHPPQQGSYRPPEAALHRAPENPLHRPPQRDSPLPRTSQDTVHRPADAAPLRPPHHGDGLLPTPRLDPPSHQRTLREGSSLLPTPHGLLPTPPGAPPDRRPHAAPHQRVREVPQHRTHREHRAHCESPLQKPPRHDSPQRRPPQHMLFPESDWERPSPPRDLSGSQASLASTSSSSSVRQVDENPQHSPPLSSYVERISMSSPSNHNEVVQPRSPSPEVVAQIPGAFAQGKEPSDKRFEQGREILRKLMVGMSKTLDEGEGSVDLEQPRSGPKIIPLERASSGGTPDSDPVQVEAEVIEERLPSRRDSKCGDSSAPGPSSRDLEAYNPEVEWNEAPAKTSLRPQFMTKPPLSQADLEELNRELGTDSEGQIDKASKGDKSAKVDKAECHSKHLGDKSDGRSSSGHTKIKILPGESFEDARRRHFQEWKKAEKEKYRERRKREKAEARAAEERRSKEAKSNESPKLSSHHSHYQKPHPSGPVSHSKAHKAERHASGDGLGLPLSLFSKKSEDCAKDSGAIVTDKSGGDVKEATSRDSSLDRQSSTPDPSVRKVSEQLKRFSVEDLVQTAQKSLSPGQKKELLSSAGKKKGLLPIPRGNHTNIASVNVGREGIDKSSSAASDEAKGEDTTELKADSAVPVEKKVPADDFKQTAYKCLLIRNLPPNTLRQHILRFFQGFGMIEMVLEVDFSFNCTGIGYVELVDSAEANHARQELLDKPLLGKPVKMAPCAEGIFREAMRTYGPMMNSREEQYAKRQENLASMHSSMASGFPSGPRGFHPGYPGQVRGPGPHASHPSAANFGVRSAHPGHPRFGSANMSPLMQSARFPTYTGSPNTGSNKPFFNPYGVRPGEHVPERVDPRLDKNDPRRVEALQHKSARGIEAKRTDPRLAATDARINDPKCKDPRVRSAERPQDPRIAKGTAAQHSAKHADPRLHSSATKAVGNNTVALDTTRIQTTPTSKPDQKSAARLSFEEQYQHKKEKEKAILRKRKEEREKKKRKEERSRAHSRHSSHLEKKSGGDVLKVASLSSFKIPKIKRSESIVEKESVLEKEKDSIKEKEPVKEREPVKEKEPIVEKKHIDRPPTSGEEPSPSVSSQATGFKERAKNTEQSTSPMQIHQSSFPGPGPSFNDSVSNDNEHTPKRCWLPEPTRRSWKKSAPEAPSKQPEKPEKAECHQEDVVSSTVDTDEFIGVKKKKKRTRIVLLSDTESDSEPCKPVPSPTQIVTENKESSSASVEGPLREQTREISNDRAVPDESDAGEETPIPDRRMVVKNDAPEMTTPKTTTAIVESDVSEARTVVESSDVEKSEDEEPLQPETPLQSMKKPVVVLSKSDIDIAAEAKARREAEQLQDTTYESISDDDNEQAFDVEEDDAAVAVAESVSAVATEAEVTATVVDAEPGAAAMEAEVNTMPVVEDAVVERATVVEQAAAGEQSVAGKPTPDESLTTKLAAEKELPIEENAKNEEILILEGGADAHATTSDAKGVDEGLEPDATEDKSTPEMDIAHRKAPSLNELETVGEKATATDTDSVSEETPLRSSTPIIILPKRDPQIEPEECEYCSFNGKKVISHYIISHPGKCISVKMPPDMLEEALTEDLGPGDDSAKAPLSEELQKSLLNDDLSWIPTSLQFDYNVACRYCKFTALNRRHMMQHMDGHLQAGTSAPQQYSLRCRFCKIKNCSSHDMTDHLTSHTGEYRYACGHCGYRVFRMFHLKTHVSGMHKGKSHDAVTVEEMDIANDWVYGYVCKLCGYVQLSEENVRKHMIDSHDSGDEPVKINLVERGPAVDMSRKVAEALRRQKLEEERYAAARPAPIEDISVFEVAETWLSEQSAQVSSRRALMDNLLVKFSTKLKQPQNGKCGTVVERVASERETPMKYLENEREQRVKESADKVIEEKPSRGEEAEPETETVEETPTPAETESDCESERSVSPPPPVLDTPEDEAELSMLAAELRASAPEDASQFGYQVALKLAGALETKFSPPSVPAPPAPPAQPTDFTVKQEPVDAEADARAAAGLSAVSADLESLMNAFDQFEQEEQQERPTLRIRKLSGDMFSTADAEDSGGDVGGMGLMISSVESLTPAGSDALGTSNSGVDESSLFSFPPDSDRRPWKHFLTLKDQSKLMRLMFHMHHKSAYKCNAVHCSFTTNNGTLFKLHLRNHDRCDICAVPGVMSGYTCMNTRLVCVYCGYQGADLAEHVYRRHAVSQFQCGYCFYRTRQNAYMHEHQRRWHADMPTYFLQSDPANPPPGLNTSHLQETEMVGESSLAPYVCAQPGCSGSFIKAAVLEQHYAETHPTATSFPCHLCACSGASFKSLIAHYIGHGYVAYHCAYCTYANQNQNSVKKHLIDFHPDDPPKCYARIPKSMGLDTVSSTPTPAAAPVRPVSLLATVKQEPSVDTSVVKEEPRSAAEDQAAAEPASVDEPPPVELEEAADSTTQPEKDKEPEKNEEVTAPEAAEKTAEEPRLLLADDLYRCGNPRCAVRCDTATAFREHLSTCPLNEAGQLLCYHCPKQVKHVSSAMEHVRSHGPSRYACSLCAFSAAVPSYVTRHLKQQHRVVLCSTLPLRPDAVDPERDAFVVYPKALVPQAEQPAEASGDDSQLTYGLEEADQLPRRPVLFRPVHCRLCSYSSKVTRNLWKHLLRHRAESAAPLPLQTPTNPRPCDKRHAMISDQMANLASSSGEVGTPRKQPDISPADLERLPKEVTEDKRYICSLPDCNYLTLNDTMLKYHIQALHGQMITYPCPHCDDLYMMPDKLSTHLRLHGPRLYKCKYCIYNHYQRSLVTRHVRDKHPMLPPVDIVVREPEDDEAAAKPAFKPWRCGLCRYAALTQAEAMEHASAAHDMHNQYKCGVCHVSGVSRAELQTHFTEKHADQPAKVFAVYYRLDEEVAEVTLRAERCTPIWQRNNPRRIHHVRGILIEEVKVPRGSSASPQKRGRKSTTSSAATSPTKKPAPLKLEQQPEARKAAANQVRRRALRKALRQPAALRRLRARPRQLKTSTPSPEPEPEREVVEVTSSPEPAQEPELAAAAAPPQTEDEFLSLYETQSNTLELGPLGDAVRDLFCCPKCATYKTKLKQHFINHLYRELNYNRFVCGNCGHMNTTLANMKRHHELSHKPARVPEALLPLTPDRELEQWIERVVERQQCQLDGREPPSLLSSSRAPPNEPTSQPQQESGPAAAPSSPKPSTSAPGTPKTSKSQLSPPKSAKAELEPSTPPGPDLGARTTEPAPPEMSPTITPVMYKCMYCQDRGSVAELRIHWKLKHPTEKFKVKQMGQKFTCRLCVFNTHKRWVMQNHLKEQHPGSAMDAFVSSQGQREVRYKCGWCSERYPTAEQCHAHHQRKHADREQKVVPYLTRALRKPVTGVQADAACSAGAGDASVSAADELEAPILQLETTPPQPARSLTAPVLQAQTSAQLHTQPESAASTAAPLQAETPQKQLFMTMFQCPICPFKTERIHNMNAHVTKHFKRFRCGWCDFTASAKIRVARHHQRAHWNLQEKIELVHDVNEQLAQAKQRVREIHGPSASRASDTSPVRPVATAAAATSGVAAAAAAASAAPAAGPRGQKRAAGDDAGAETEAPAPAAGAVKRASKGGVARKSTARARLLSGGGRAVAVKSTGGLRRSATPTPFSFYGSRPPAVASFSEVTTPLMVGGASAMRVNVPTLAQIVKLYPRCVCVDLRASSSVPR